MDDILIAAREALLDTLEALAEHASSIVVIGAQAVHLRTPGAPTLVPAATSDVDLGLRVAVLADTPRIEDALQAAGFTSDGTPGTSAQPGSWRTPSGIHVDIMVPAKDSPKGRRAATIPPHARRVARKTPGIEGIVVDADLVEITSLVPGSDRTATALVAGPAALLIAKITKIAERLDEPRHRLIAKDAHDIYRLALAIGDDEWTARLSALHADTHARPVAAQARHHFQALFGPPDAPGYAMIAQTEAATGAADEAIVAMGALARDIAELWDQAATHSSPPHQPPPSWSS